MNSLIKKTHLINWLKNQGGGGTPANVEEKDINFYDYDGTRLYSYTLAEIQELTELPELPEHDGLICQGWNWTLADIKAEEKETDVGAMYITDDGKTRLYINIDSEYRTRISLCFRQSIANGIEVDWGDGSQVETFSGNGTTNIQPNHIYTNVGNYIITLKPLNDCILTLGGEASNYSILGVRETSRMMHLHMLRKVEIGTGVTKIHQYAFQFCNLLSSITIPKTVISIDQYAFETCYALSSIVIPTQMTSIGDYVFFYCYSLSKIIFSKSITTMGNYIFQYCVLLLNIKLPNISDINDYAFQYCYNLASIIIPDTVTNIKSYAFDGCRCLGSILLPKNLTSIGNYAFRACNILYFDFSNCLQIPTLGTGAIIMLSGLKIVVPDSLYEDWIVATNWSNYASYIIKKSDWDAL